MISSMLLIDDDEDVIIYTEYLVKKSGLVENFNSATDGEEGLKFLQTHDAPDLILLDINMPKMNGWEFIEQYKKMNFSKSIILAMLTVSINPDDQKRADDAKIAFINKPLTPEKLEKVIQLDQPK